MAYVPPHLRNRQQQSPQEGGGPPPQESQPQYGGPPPQRSGGYNDRRGYGGRGGGRHTGVDIKTRANDTIRCAFNGIVRMSKPYYAYGNIVVIRHANGLETLYSHNFKNLVKTGDVVKAGQPIGLTGRTGRATTEHVHFETRINGQHFNPNLIFDLKERTLRKECIKCTKNGSKIVVKTQIPDNRIAQNKK